MTSRRYSRKKYCRRKKGSKGKKGRKRCWGKARWTAKGKGDPRTGAGTGYRDTPKGGRWKKRRRVVAIPRKGKRESKLSNLEHRMKRGESVSREAIVLGA